jgi:hypothetical protein
MMNNYSQYSQAQQQSQMSNSTALVPATAPGKTIYSNYAFQLSDDLIDLGGNNDDMAFATPPSAAGSTTVVEPSISNSTTNRDRSENIDLKALQDRDDEFVKNLPADIIEEQKRILSQIQEQNRANHNGQLELYSPSIEAEERYQHRFDAMPTENGESSSLPAEVHPRKYQMKTERKVKTAASAATGAVIGGLILAPVWPIGAAAGAAAGGYAVKVISRSGERKQQRKWDRKNFNEYTAQGHCDVQSSDVAFA